MRRESRLNGANAGRFSGSVSDPKERHDGSALAAAVIEAEVNGEKKTKGTGWRARFIEAICPSSVEPDAAAARYKYFKPSFRPPCVYFIMVCTPTSSRMTVCEHPRKT